MFKSLLSEHIPARGNFVLDYISSRQLFSRRYHNKYTNTCFWMKQYPRVYVIKCFLKDRHWGNIMYREEKQFN